MKFITAESLDYQEKKLIYDSRDVWVFLMGTVIPVFLSRVDSTYIPAQDIKFTVKVNKDGCLRHGPEVFKQENEVLSIVSKHPVLSQYTPLHLAPIDEEKGVVTQFIDAVALESCIEDKSISPSVRLHYIRKLIKYLYFLHKLGIHHNDFHDKNILVTLTNDIVVIDYGMAGQKNTIQQQKYFDIHQLNKIIYRLIESEMLTLSEPWHYQISIDATIRFVESLSSKEAAFFVCLVQMLPCTDDSLDALFSLLEGY